MKKLLSVLLCIGLIALMCKFGFFSFTARANTSGITGDCTWTLNGTELTISGNGAMGESKIVWDAQAGKFVVSTPWGHNITKVTVEDGVTSIGNFAFEECPLLTVVSIPESIKRIGIDAFSGCDSLQYNTYENAEYLGNDTNPYVALISADNSIISSAINSDTKIICDYAFSGCKSLESIEIPDSVKGIGSYAFNICTSLKVINIPASVTDIGEAPFFNCTSLENINVNLNNAEYEGKGNCLIDKKTKALIQGCKASVIPADGSVRSIEKSAFSGCSSLTDLKIPSSVINIESDAFFYCISLTKITIPAGITSIGKSAFEFCTSLNKVIYCGTEEEKSAIYIADGNDSLINAVWQYHDYSAVWSHGGICHWHECTVCGDKKDTENHTDADEDNICDVCLAAISNIEHGDITGDGEINAKDLTRLKKLLSGQAVEYSVFGADVNGDGNISAKDLTRLKKILAGQ